MKDAPDSICWSKSLSAKSCNPGSIPIGANLRKLSLKLSSPHLLPIICTHLFLQSWSRRKRSEKWGFFCTHGLAALSKIPQYPLRQAIDLESFFGAKKICESNRHLLRGPTAQQAPMYGVRKTCCSGTQIQTSTNNRGTMGPRNKCGDDKIGCIFSLKLAPMESCPGQAFAGICSNSSSRRPVLRSKALALRS